jgi:hypothetical protein
VVWNWEFPEACRFFWPQRATEIFSVILSTVAERAAEIDFLIKLVLLVTLAFLVIISLWLSALWQNTGFTQAMYFPGTLLNKIERHKKIQKSLFGNGLAILIDPCTPFSFASIIKAVLCEKPFAAFIQERNRFMGAISSVLRTFANTP